MQFVAEKDEEAIRSDAVQRLLLSLTGRRTPDAEAVRVASAGLSKIAERCA